MVSAEFAIISPAYIMVTLALFAGLGLGAHYLELYNEAREIAREVSLHGTSELATTASKDGARVSFSRNGEILDVKVERQLLGIDYSASYSVVMEPGVSYGY